MTNLKYLERVGEFENVPENIKLIVNILLTAINDWPNEINSLEEYDISVQMFMGSNSNKDNILKALKNIDYSKNSWESESLTQLLDVFDLFDEKLSLTEIIEKINYLSLENL